MKLILSILSFVVTVCSFAQNHSFPFGQVTLRELQMTTYDLDTTARAVVLNEFGEAYLNNASGADFGLIVFEYHVKIKILKPSGTDKGNFEVVLRKNDSGDYEKWESVTASTFNANGNSIKETPLDKKGIFVDKQSKYRDVVKFTLPETRVGSVIEVMYRYQSPFRFNFHPWVFQDDIPKVRSEFWASIPGNFIYNIALRGFLKLSRNESSLVKDCFESGSQKADCAFYKYAMERIPAFREEEYVNAKSNYISGISYELSEFQSFSGGRTKYTKTWEAVEIELRNEENFGKQIRKANNQSDDQLKAIAMKETDQLARAKAIYSYINHWFDWNDIDGMFTYLGVKDAYEQRKGNIADINLTLVGVLQAYGLDADAVILSTRRNGAVTELYPVITQFDYVIARVVIDGKVYLLDATDSFLPFGTIPERCLNGKGRIMRKGESDWVELKAAEKNRKIVALDLQFDDSGNLKGTLKIQSSGYAAVDVRKSILSNTDQKDHIKSFERMFNGAEISNLVIENLEDLSKPVIEKMDMVLPEFNIKDAPVAYFNPFSFFVGNYITKNPFKSAEREYPIDWGTPEENTMVLTLKLPDSVTVDEMPANAALVLPNGGGKFIIAGTTLPGKVMVTNTMAMNKTTYLALEYHSLKEFFARVVQAQQSQFVIKKK